MTVDAYRSRALRTLAALALLIALLAGAVGVPAAGVFAAAPDAVDDAATVGEDASTTVDVLDNHTDPDGDLLIITDATDSLRGTVVVDFDGSAVTYVPDAGYVGEDTFDYAITDGFGGTDAATVTMTVEPLNDETSALDDEAMTAQNTAVVIDVLANDTDVEDDPLDVTGTTAPTNGSVEVNDDDTVTYTPEVDYAGPDAFGYTIRDESGNESRATVTVDPVDDGPAAVDGAASTDEDAAVAIAVLANDTHPDDDDLSVAAIASNQANGTVEILGDEIRYTPLAGFNGSDGFAYRVTDSNGDPDEALVTVTVGAVIDPPVATDDLAATPRDVAVAIVVLSNDSDPDGDVLAVTVDVAPTNGIATVEDDGSITYTSDTGFSGNDAFTYRVDDGNGGADTATVTVTVGDTDQDDDGVADEVDNCPTTANGDQLDTDGDGLGDTCDATPDGTATPTPRPTETVIPDPNPTQTPVETPTPTPSGGGSGSGSVRDGDGLPDTGTGVDVISNQWVFALGLAMAAGLIAFALAASPRRRDDLETDDR